MTAQDGREPVDVGWLDEPERLYPVVVETKSYFVVWYPGESSKDAAEVMGEDSEWYQWLPSQSEAADHDWAVEPMDEHHWAADDAYQPRHPEIGPRLPDGLFTSAHAVAVYRAEIAARLAANPLPSPAQRRPVRAVKLPAGSTAGGA